MSEQEIRLQCLQLAQLMSINKETVLKIAEEFYLFVHKSS